MAEQTLVVKQTCFGYPDNDPANSDNISNPVVHQRAGGTGTEADPITLAVAPAATFGGGRVPYGTRFYIPDLYKYFVAEDWCQDAVDEANSGITKVHLDLWVGGQGANASDVIAYENSVTNFNRTVIMNPNPGKPVNPGGLWDTKTKTSGNTPPSGGGTGGQMAEFTKIVYNTCYSWHDNNPPGDGIAYPGFQPARHTRASGDGTWENPITVAGCDAQIPRGTICHVPELRCYLVMEDYCQFSWDQYNAGVQQWNIDIWVDGRNAQAQTVWDYMNGINSFNREVIFNALPGKNVIKGGLFDTRRLNTGNPPGSPSPATAPPPTGSGTGTVRTINSFGYAFKDNGPGTGIAFGGAAPRHSSAGGLGTYANPITVAVPAALRTGGLAIGSRIYIEKVVNAAGTTPVNRYGVVEDDAGANLGIWVGGAASTSTTSQANADAAVSGTATIYTGVNDQWSVPVQGDLVTQFGSGTGTPPPPPPPPPPTGGTGTQTSRKSFGYTSLDGTGIAFGGAAPRHPSAGGLGTYANPITLAVTAALRTGGLAIGQRVYIDTVTHTDGSVTNIKRYFVVEDDGAPDVGIYGGVASNATTAAAVNALVSGTAKVYTGVNDQWPVPVQGDLVAQYGGTTQPPPPPPPPPGQIVTVSANNGTYQPAIGAANQDYWFANETWCVGNLRNGTDFTMAADIPTGSFPNGTNIRWSLPDRNADCGVWGYMTIQYGTEDGGNWRPPTGRTPFQPMQIKNAQQITTDFDVVRGGSGSYDVLGEIWLENAPNSGPAIEVGVFFHDPNNGIATASDAISYQAANGQRVFAISRQGGSNTPFYCIGFQNSLNSGVFDWKELFNFLTQRGWVSGNEYFSGLDFGVEPFRGGGTLKVNRLVQTVR